MCTSMVTCENAPSNPKIPDQAIFLVNSRLRTLGDWCLILITCRTTVDDEMTGAVSLPREGWQSRPVQTDG
jgi:hypothetical protein